MNMESEDARFLAIADSGAEPTEVFHSTSRAEAREHALVLAAMGISSTLKADGAGGLRILVPARNEAQAREQLARYARENRGHAGERAAAPAARPLVDGLTSTMIAGAFLVLLFAWSRQHAFFQDWVSLGAAQVGLMTNGQWWRAVTALGLHADLSHLAGNLVFGSLFGLVLAQALGPGLAWLAIVTAGAAGNLLNAWVQPAVHTAIGASTAVFAAVGILSGLNWRRETRRRRRGLRRWAPLAGGLMLLVYLGLSGERTDIGGHVAGFIAGGVLGSALAYAYAYLPSGRLAQRLCGAAAAAIFIAAWMLALSA